VQGHAFVEFARRRGDFAIVAVGCLLALDAKQAIRRAAISLVGVAYAPVRLALAEKLLTGTKAGEDAIEAAAAEARKIEAKSDLFASGAYRQRLAGVLTARAVNTAYQRALGKTRKMTDKRTITLTVNGQRHTREVETRLHLADFLRRELRLTGTHLGCEHGVCGACTVLLDGEAVRSCIMFAVQADARM
jgi:xanthine dehydrogenase iron-sulfur cluster and FAD-binding subunit A